MLKISMIIITISILSVFIKIVISKSVYDKLLALNLMAVLITMFLVTFAVDANKPFIMDIAIAYSIIGFWVLVLLIRYVDKNDKS